MPTNFSFRALWPYVKRSSYYYKADLTIVRMLLNILPVLGKAYSDAGLHQNQLVA